MLTEVKAYSSWPSAPELLLEDSGRAETDLIQIRNIDGLDPVKASVNTSPFGAVDGTAYVGSSILSRNIVLTIHPNPDWNNWTFTSLRKLLYLYFMPKRPVKLVFYSDDMFPVEIDGIVEDITPNLFSQDPEILVSIVCPDPFFTSVNPIIITGQTGGWSQPIEYNGTIETGMEIKISQASGSTPTKFTVQLGDLASSYLELNASVDATKYLELSSVPMQKYVRNIDLSNGIITNLLSKMVEGSDWPVFQPGENRFSVISDAGIQDWELTYYERFGGL